MLLRPTTLLTETAERLEAIEAKLRRLEHAPADREALNNILSMAHTVSSAFGFLGLSHLEAVACDGEALLHRCRDDAAGAIPLVLDAIERIKKLLAEMDITPIAADGDGRAHIDQRKTATVARQIEARNLGSTSYRVAIENPEVWDEKLEASPKVLQPCRFAGNARGHEDDFVGGRTLQARSAKPSRFPFLAAVNHDLRLPLQTLALLPRLLAKRLKDRDSLRLVTRADEAVMTMSAALNALLDINQLEEGLIRPEVHDFPVNELFMALTTEFSLHARAKGLDWRMFSSKAAIRADPRLLGQLIRSLLSNAIAHSGGGALLLGCRRRGKALRIEVWDTGLRIPSSQTRATRGEAHEPEVRVREPGRGGDLGLSIVRRLGDLLGIAVDVYSSRERGSVFVIEVSLAASGAALPKVSARAESLGPPARQSSILIVHADPALRESLDLLLRAEGHTIASVANGDEAVRLIARGLRPDFLVIDDDLPGRQTDLEVIVRLRSLLARDIPVLVLTGDVSTGRLREIAALGYEQRSKSVAPGDLSEIARRLLCLADTPLPVLPEPADSLSPVVFLIDGNDDARAALGDLLRANGRPVCDYRNAEDFLVSYHSGVDCILLVDVATPGMGELTLLDRLGNDGFDLPTIALVSNGDVPSAVRAMRAGAADVIERPVGKRRLFAAIDRVFERARNSHRPTISRGDATARLANLTPRQRRILEMVLNGQPSKIIAAELGISQRTVETHRAAIMRKTDSRSLAELVRLALAST